MNIENQNFIMRALGGSAPSLPTAEDHRRRLPMSPIHRLRLPLSLPSVWRTVRYCPRCRRGPRRAERVGAKMLPPIVPAS